MSDNDKVMKEYVEDKIMKYTFHAKNFSKEDMERVDEYCKKHYGNDRKKMILTLITLVEDNIAIKILDDKMNLFASSVFTELDNINKQINQDNNKKEKVESKAAWKGFGDKK